jgi:hypothetical protein
MPRQHRDADDFRRDMEAIKAARERANIEVGAVHEPPPRNVSAVGPTDAEMLQLGDAARAAWKTIKKTFEAWVTIGAFLVPLRAQADKIGKRTAFQKLLVENDLDYFASREGKSTATNILRIMKDLPEVQAWRGTLSLSKQIEWSSPRSILGHCPVFKAKATERGQGGGRKHGNAAHQTRHIAELEARNEELQQEHAALTPDQHVDALLAALNDPTPGLIDALDRLITELHARARSAEAQKAQRREAFVVEKNVPFPTGKRGKRKAIAAPGALQWTADTSDGNHSAPARTGIYYIAAAYGFTASGLGLPRQLYR